MSNILYLYITPQAATAAIPVIAKFSLFDCVRMNHITQTFKDRAWNTGYIRCVQSPLDVDRLVGVAFSKIVNSEIVLDKPSGKGS